MEPALLYSMPSSEIVKILNIPRFLVLFLLLAGNYQLSYADSSAAAVEEAECAEQTAFCENEPLPDNDSAAQQSEPFFSFLDRPQQAVSSGLAGMATAMDEFFADERVYYDKSGSYVRLTLDTLLDEEHNDSYSGDVKVKLELPRTEEKLKLTFESDPDESRDALDRTLEDSPRDAAQERDYYGGIQATLGDEHEWRFKPGIGVKFSKPIDIFLRLRIDRNYKIGNWLFRPSQTFYTFKEKGFGSETSFDLDHSLTDHLLFRSSSFVRYTDEKNYFEPSQLFSLIHRLSENRGVVYQVGVYGITEPALHATDYLAQVRYRQNIHSDYLFVELIPRLIYQRENNFHPEQSLTLRLEMIFEG